MSRLQKREKAGNIDLSRRHALKPPRRGEEIFLPLIFLPAFPPHFSVPHLSVSLPLACALRLRHSRASALNSPPERPAKKVSIRLKSFYLHAPFRHGNLIG